MKIQALVIIGALLCQGHATLVAHVRAPGAYEMRSRIIWNAKKYIGTRYNYGGNNASGFDCSGFVQFIYGKNGIPLPRTSIGQFEQGLKIDLAKAEPGDLVFFKIDFNTISHVGIYLNKSEFIHAPSSGKQVSVDSLDAGYWKKRFAGAVTYIKNTMPRCTLRGRMLHNVLLPHTLQGYSWAFLSESTRCNKQLTH
jgi:hypothetical protein